MNEQPAEEASAKEGLSSVGHVKDDEAVASTPLSPEIVREGEESEGVKPGIRNYSPRISVREKRRIGASPPRWWRRCPQCCEGSRGAIRGILLRRACGGQAGGQAGLAFVIWHAGDRRPWRGDWFTVGAFREILWRESPAQILSTCPLQHRARPRLPRHSYTGNNASFTRPRISGCNREQKSTLRPMMAASSSA